jgi:hypothetical protein
MKILFLLSGFVFSFNFSFSQTIPCYQEKFTDTIRPVFEKINLQASYKGFGTKWNPFLQKNVSFSKIIGSLPDSLTYYEDSVTMKFIVSRDGMISNLEILCAGNEQAGKEAIRLIKASCPDWDPGVDSGGVFRNSWHQETFYFIVDRREKKTITKVWAKF